MFGSLDFVYAPVEDVVAASDRYVEALGATLVWRVRAMATVVACLQLAESGPRILLTDHLEGDEPILVYRVADFASTVAALRAGGVRELRSLAIPHGPLASFRAPGGTRLAVYQLTWPGAAASFDGRIDD